MFFLNLKLRKNDQTISQNWKSEIRMNKIKCIIIYIKPKSIE